MKFNHAIGEIIKEIRTEEKMLTLRQLSTKSSVALGYISEVERGQKEGSSEILECLAKALDYDLCDLVILAGWRMKMRATEFDKKFLLDLELQNK